MSQVLGKKMANKPVICRTVAELCWLPPEDVRLATGQYLLAYEAASKVGQPEAKQLCPFAPPNDTQ